MKTRFQPLPDGEPPLTIPQFLQRLRHEPGFAEKMQAHYESMLAEPQTPQTLLMRQQAADALRTLKHHQGLWKGMNCLLRANAMMDEDGFLDDPELRQQIATLTDEASDHLLDVLEPDRKPLMGAITKIRKSIHTLSARRSNPV